MLSSIIFFVIIFFSIKSWSRARLANFNHRATATLTHGDDHDSMIMLTALSYWQQADWAGPGPRQQQQQQ